MTSPSNHCPLNRAATWKYFVHSVTGVDIASVCSQLGMIWEINTTTWKTHRSMLLKWIVPQTFHCALNLVSEDTLRKYKRWSGPVSDFFFWFSMILCQLGEVNFYALFFGILDRIYVQFKPFYHVAKYNVIYTTLTLFFFSIEDTVSCPDCLNKVQNLSTFSSRVPFSQALVHLCSRNVRHRTGLVCLTK